jgi:uncharacterized protein (DUF302 family)
MTKQTPTRAYGFGTTVAAPYDQTVERTKAALKEQGFGVLTEIDVKKTMKEKLDVDFRSYVILGACNPPLAHRALEADLGVGLLLPCNVVVYDNGDGSSSVEVMDPEAAFGLIEENPAVREIACDAKERLLKVISALGAPKSERYGETPR